MVGGGLINQIPKNTMVAMTTPAPSAAGSPQTADPSGSKTIPLFQANLQPQPPQPPETIATEQDRLLQINYENWLNQQNTVLSNQLKYYETEIVKLRKVKKQLNTKQRHLRKQGNELTENDAKELQKITADHTVIQKQLENARRQQRQHSVILQEYKTKHQSGKPASSGASTPVGAPGSSPAQSLIAPPSPLMSPSPSSQPGSLYQPTVQSPLSNLILQPNQSPLHSPSPLLSHSPGPASVNSSVLQSPGGNHTNSNSAMSPYSTMQPSPRIGTPHSQIDENPFSPGPGGGPSPSPSLPGRLTSPAPRMTSPQHRMAGQQMVVGGPPHGPQPGQSFGYIKLGLRGGSPMWGNARGNKRANPVRKQTINTAGTLVPHRNRITIVQKPAGGITTTTTTLNTVGVTIKPVGGGTEPATAISSGASGSGTVEEIVVIDSSPDEKQQRLLDYDDDNDKALVGTEVSLNSVAQHGVDGDEAIMESFGSGTPAGYDIVGSPLDSQIAAGEYNLFSDDVVECVDSEDGGVTAGGAKKDARTVAVELLLDADSSAKDKPLLGSSEIEIVESIDESSIGTTAEDFEAMIDSRPKTATPPTVAADGAPSAAKTEPTVTVTRKEEKVVEKVATPKKEVTLVTVHQQQQQQSPKPISYPTARIAIQQSLMQNRPIVSAAHQRLVKDATESTAKLSIGNTTISVPILKSFPMTATPSKAAGTEQNAASKAATLATHSKKLINTSGGLSISNISKNPAGGTVIAVGGQKINTTSIVTLSSLNLNQSSPFITKTFARHGGGLTIQQQKQLSVGSQIKIQQAGSVVLQQQQQQQQSAQPTATSSGANATSPKPKVASTSSLSYAKLSSLTVTQDTSLPTKIFEDDSISPDSSISQEDAEQPALDKSDLAGPAEEAAAPKTTSTETPGGLDTPATTAETTQQPDGQSVKGKQNIIPVHVIAKSRENSRSPILTGAGGQRIVSSIPQLSPLSQPNELTLNAMNVSQQVRSIMSSISVSNAASVAGSSSAGGGGTPSVVLSMAPSTTTAAGTTSVASSVAASNISTITFDTILPSKGDNMSKTETIASILKTVSGKTILPAAAIASNSNLVKASEQQSGSPSLTSTTITQIPATKLITQQLQLSRLPGQTIGSGNSNFLVVKQLRTPNKQTGQNHMQKQLVVLTQQGQGGQQIKLQTHQTQQLAAGNSVIIQSQPGSSGGATGSFMKISTTPTIVSTAAGGGDTASSKSVTTTVDTTSASGIATILNNANAQQQQQKTLTTSQQPAAQLQSSTSRAATITSINVTSTTATPVASILSATLSQPLIKTSSHMPSSITTLLQSQLQSAASFRRSKSTDEAPAHGHGRETASQILSKRLSLESTNVVKSEPVDSASDDASVSSSTAQAASSTGCKFSTMPSAGTVAKSEDSQNVLLKQLLQNSGSSSASSVSSPAPSPIGRAVPSLITSQRAPSLGVVSSLEAQLARPVIPPSANPPAIQLISSQPIPAIAASISSISSSTVSTAAAASTPSAALMSPSGISSSHPTPNLAANMLAASMKKEEMLQAAAAAAATTITTTTTTSGATVGQGTVKLDSGTITVTQLQASQPTVTTAAASQQLQTTVTAAKSAMPPQQQQVNSLQFTQQNNQLQSKTLPNAATVQQIGDTTIVRTPTPTPSPGPMQQPSRPPSAAPRSETPVDIKKEPEQSLNSGSASVASATTTTSTVGGPSPVSTVPTATAIKEEPTEPLTAEQAAKRAAELALELKKKKRREYQKNRRQMQIQSNKDNAHSQAKKKPKKSVKIEEDYDTCIDNLMGQLRQLPQMQILEPQLPRNYGVCSVFGTGDLSKFTNLKGYSIATGDLTGRYGDAQIPSIADFYNTKPFGVKDPPPEPTPVSVHRGFYDQEFAPIKFETEDRQRYEFVRDRDLDSPDTIISTSSPECLRWDSPVSFPGLRLIKEEPAEDEQTAVYRQMSPVIPILAPIPIRLRKGFTLSADSAGRPQQGANVAGSNKENEGFRETAGVKSRFGPPTPLKDTSNVTVTLTLTSSAVDDIFGVLRDLANMLEIPPPTTYQIVERTVSPTSQKLGLYRTKGRDGKEGAPIDIQTILNGSARFCRHCDVVILSNIIIANASEFPLLAANGDVGGQAELESEELYFCGEQCYRQFRCCPTSILDEAGDSSAGAAALATGEGTAALSHKPDTGAPNVDVAAVSGAVEIKQEVLEDVEMEDVTAGNSSTGSVKDAPGSGERKKKHPDDGVEVDVLAGAPPTKQMKGVRYKVYTPNCFGVQRFKKPSEKEITETLFRMSITVAPTPKMPDDTRRCIFCHTVGDGVADGPSRLLNYDVDKWVHLNCALWSDGVYETVNGALMNLENALQQSLTSVCAFCSTLGATVKCFKTRCANVYHLSCAMKDSCVFYKNKTTMCQTHAPKTEKDSELTTLSVQRRVYVDRDESRQVASVMHHSESNNLLRVGSLIFLNVGQLLPHQLQSFHTPNYIYPIGYKIIRFYWSMRRPNKRCRYICSIADVCGRPEFRVLVQETAEEDIELRDATPKAVWQRILEPMAQLRKSCQIVQLFPKYISGEDLFGLTEPAVVRILESLPGIETLTDYRFKYGRNPLLELPLAINPSGAARTEPKLKHTLSWKKPHTQRTGSVSQRPTFVPTSSPAGEVACPYSKQFVHSKSSQYKKMKQEWRNNVFLARSKIQGLGLYAARDLEKHTMVIEYIGEVIRTEVSEMREKQYEARNRGIYMFRLDEERVVDATLSGGLARYINHSCNPNCVTEIVEVDRELRIIIFAKRRINRGEELSYDYKFDIEDDAHKISCMCGAPNCKKWMN
ncbi:AGAP011192-PA [Anopheles gambiae str. PEST]|uniref:AGAP011192-PA n=1 Tax=Anopheles gambiae TaxID=7165 RepID=Q7QHI0_ANOGA|nr:AGAP011192-PA [Anopheles gambiae str. PEST]